MLDALGHPLEVGTTILTTKHYETEFSLVTKIVKRTSKAAYIEVDAYVWCEDTRQHILTRKPVRRKAHQMIAISAQLDYNQTNYPENQL